MGIWFERWCAFVVTYVAMVTAQTGTTPGNIYLEDGAYKGILIAIDQQVPYDYDLYDNLQQYFLEASEALFTATSLVSRRRFGEITILIPKTWSNMDFCTTATTEIQYEANFIVERDTAMYGAMPHTLKLDAQCGTPGEATYLPESFVKYPSHVRQRTPYIGRLMLHEWSHLRYGLFDEFDHVQHPESCIYLDQDQVEAIKCPVDLEGRFTINDARQSCSFTPDEDQIHHVMGSLMYDSQLDSALTWCNKTGRGLEHNGEPPNPQNNRCGGRSGWEVLMEHPDFRDHHVSAPLEGRMMVRCIQERELDRMVLVMDISGSMQEEHRILRMQQDVQLFLKSMPCRDTSIGMVEFSGNMTEARTTHQLARLDRGDNLETLTNAIPTVTKDATCIGCGILRAIELLEQSGQVVDGSVMLLFTDGEENTPPYINQVRNEVLSKGIIVYGIMMREYASQHPLIDLAGDTGGKSCIFSDNQHTSYYDCLNAVLHHRSPQTAPNQLLNKVLNVRFRDTRDIFVNVDSNIGDQLSIIITWSSSFLSGCKDTLFTATAPNGTILSNNTVNRHTRNDALRTASIDASGFSPGRWMIRVDNQDHWEHCEARILVESRRLLLNCSSGVGPDVQQPVLIFPSVGSTVIRVSPDNDLHDNAVKLYTEVLRGSDPVLNATVKAEIENDEGDRWTIDLQDNGVGADLEADDGVYSRYFTNYTGDGTYTVKIDVEGYNTTRVLANNGTDNDTERYTTLEPFQRTQGSNYFEVTGYNEVDADEREELFPPSTITDLKVTVVRREGDVQSRRRRDAEYDYRYFKLVLEWSAAEVHDQRDGARYEIRMATSASILRDTFEMGYPLTQQDLQDGQLNSIKPFGEKEFFVVALNRADMSVGIHFIALKTIDGSGRGSDLSNVGIFTFTVQDLPSTTPTTTSTTSTTTSTANTNSDHSSISPGSGDGQTGEQKDGKKSDDSFPDWMYYVIAGLCGLLLIMCFVVCCICCCRSRNSDEKKARKIEALKAAQRELSVHASFPPGTTVLDEIQCDIIETTPDRISISQEPDIIQQTHSNSSSVNPTPNTTISKNANATWPSIDKPGQSQKKRGNILRTFGKGHFFSDLKKKFRGSKASMEDTHAVVERQWSNPTEPVQNIPYSNPLFGQALTHNEVVMKNSVIDAPYVLDVDP